MSPEDLAALHPRLYHLTTPGAWEGIRRHGLLSTRALLDLFEVAPDLRAATLRRRPGEMTLAHPERGHAVILLGARMNRGRARDLLVVDTLSLARAHAPRIDLSPINSGATISRPARRGLATFTPMTALVYAEWRRLRGRLDRIVEVAVRGGVPDIERHVVKVRRHPPA